MLPVVKTKSWRLLLDPALEGARNMARDMAILDAVIRHQAPPTLRFYSWSPPCLSLGKHQGPDAVDLDFCRSRHIDVVRRPTGGRAVLHHLELTYALIAPLGSGPLPLKIQEAYSMICGVLVGALREMGVEAELGGEAFNARLPRPSSTIPCFQAAAGGEIMVGGRKLVGSAMRKAEHCILQHGSILLDWDEKLQAGAMGAVNPGRLSASVVTIRDLLGETPTKEELIGSLCRRFEEECEICLEAGGIGEQERLMEDGLILDRRLGWGKVGR